MDNLGLISAAVKAGTFLDRPESRRRATLPWVVTISREAGIDAGEIARELVKLLDAHPGPSGPWRWFDREIVDQVAAEHHLETDLVRGADERDETFVEWMIHGLASRNPLDGVAARIAKTVRHLARDGRTVIIGRGGQSILATRDCTVHVRLIAPEPWRARRVSELTDLDEQEAQRVVHRVDAERARFVKHHFRTDPADAGLYHLIVNVSRVTPVSAARAIDAMVQDAPSTGNRSGTLA